MRDQAHARNLRRLVETAALCVARLFLVPAIVSFSISASSQSFAATPPHWLLSYEGKSTNNFIGDKRAASLISTVLPARLSADVRWALSGPPDPVFVADHRYASVSACVPHDCLDKGFLWVDTETGVGLGAHSIPGKLVLGSKGFSAEKIPSAARQALIGWVTENDIRSESVTFIGLSGGVKVLDPSAFVPLDRFQPQPTNPGFDCAMASGKIEETICKDAELSKLDLDLTNLVDEIRRGHSTTIARAQLLDLQRAWKQARDSECTNAPEMTSCLRNRYQAQHERLMNWVPTRQQSPAL